MGRFDDWIHAVLGLLGGFVVWQLKRFTDRVDGKADKEYVDKIDSRITRFEEEQERMHRENRERLDRIIDLVTSRD